MTDIPFKPADHGTVCPYLILDNVAETVDFLKTVFDAKVTSSMPGPDGKLVHAAVRIDDTVIMMGAAQPQWPALVCMLYVFVPDVDATYQRALAAGGKTAMEPTNQFYGNRDAGVIGPGGIQWWMATQKEVLTDEEISDRSAAQFGKK